MIKKSRIIIVGAGISGSRAAIELFTQRRSQTDITLIDKEPGRIGGGIAYGQSTAAPFHQTNTEASRILQAVTGNTEAMLPLLGTPANEVMDRQQVGQIMLKEIFNTLSAQSADAMYALAQDGEEASFTNEVNGNTLNIIYDEATAVTAKTPDNTAATALRSGRNLDADYIVLATGNDDQRELPLAKAHTDNPDFTSRYVANQWTKDGQEQIRGIGNDQDVLIIGTALSAYDAVRTLIHSGHKGKIVLMSRNGYEHYQFPQQINRPPSFSLPRPRFLSLLDDPKAAMAALLEEFQEYTGLTIDSDTVNVGPEEWGTRYTKPFKPMNPAVHNIWENIVPHSLKKLIYKNLPPAAVLWAWERHIPEVIEHIGIENVGGFLKKFNSLLNVFRMGVGHPASLEINAAKASGQLSVIAANFDEFEAGPDGVTVHYTEKNKEQQISRKFGAIISSLGPNTDYSKTTAPLWRDVFEKGYTEPHPIGIGVKQDFTKGAGALPGCDNIFVVGIPAAGDLIAEQGVLGSPAFSAIYMARSAENTVKTMLKNTP